MTSTTSFPDIHLIFVHIFCKNSDLSLQTVFDILIVLNTPGTVYLCVCVCVWNLLQHQVGVPQCYHRAHYTELQIVYFPSKPFCGFWHTKLNPVLLLLCVLISVNPILHQYCSEYFVRFSNTGDISAPLSCNIFVLESGGICISHRK